MSMMWNINNDINDTTKVDGYVCVSVLYITVTDVSVECVNMMLCLRSAEERLSLNVHLIWMGGVKDKCQYVPNGVLIGLNRLRLDAVLYQHLHWSWEGPQGSLFLDKIEALHRVTSRAMGPRKTLWVHLCRCCRRSQSQLLWTPVRKVVRPYLYQ